LRAFLVGEGIRGSEMAAQEWFCRLDSVENVSSMCVALPIARRTPWLQDNLPVIYLDCRGKASGGFVPAP
jgi:hypothetical protein